MKKIPKKIIAARLAKKVQSLLSKNDIKVVIVTGSIGKTSTKTAIGKLLSTKFQVRFSEDSYNTDIGLPLSFFGLKAPSPLWDPMAWRRTFQKIDSISKHYPYEIVILEMADDELEDMMKLLEVIKPYVSVLTSAAPVHMERMLNMKKVVADNWKIASSAKQVVYNSDIEEFRKLANKKSKYFGYGIKHGKFKFSNISRRKDGCLSATLSLPGGSFDIKTKLIGEKNLGGLLAAAGVALKFGMDEKEVASGIAKITAVRGRMNLLKGLYNSKIIDDSYNSSPDAVKASLEVLKEIEGKKKIAVLGNMNELGAEAQPAHYSIGQEAAKVADMLIVIGKDAETYTIAGAKAAGMDPDNIKFFKTPYEIGHFLKRIISKGDVVLVKGSQNGVFSEEVVRILLDPSLNPKDLLVRQSRSWKQKKRKSFGL